MRSIFILLLAVNLLVFGGLWWKGQQAKVPVAVVPPAAELLAGEPLVLLSEVSEQQLQEFSADRISMLEPDPAAGAGDDGGEAAPVQPLCEFVGPFPGQLEAENFDEHLGALDVAAQVRRVEVQGEPSYWVYRAPEVSRKEALRRLHELQAKGIDSYVIPKGELENGISFGVFSRLQGAEARLAEVKRLGYAADIHRMERTYEETWVVLGAGEEAKLGQELWLELLNREEGLERRQNFCPDVASR
ncbi:SPOR domain-containing protein [Pseudomaricurvus sp. HS19]|uniref:SPOR domain-containing protein n=1 Tax=Pseudomaricurvus sp. HS19 TaxID=2692626 RepID=UPI00136861AF|nr:SPOR domain-containing protein [Pseudomaricurvus sp. HS19]MYM65206.1 SPOR domain-containing protein [Pseudomaricurvus sp. HS19]